MTNAVTLNPAELVEKYLPRLRWLAYQTGADIEDVKQEAWLLAAAGVRNPQARDFVPRWLVAVERHARRQAPGWHVSAVDVEQVDGDDPAGIMEAVESVADMLAGNRLDQVIGIPKTTRELAEVLGKSERQARRDKKRLEQFSRVQGDFWGAPV